MEVVLGGKEASGDGGLEGGKEGCKVHSRQDMEVAEVGMAFGTHYFLQGLQGQTDDLERPHQHLVCIYFFQKVKIMPI